MNFDLLKSVTGISPEDVQHYLSKTGWAKVDYKKPDQLKFQNDDIFVIFPSARKSDFSLAVRNLVITLSQFEKREPLEVIKNILSPNVDEIKFRFFGGEADTGSLPLDYMLNAVESIRDSIIFSACSEINAQPSYKKQTRDAVKLVERARFGQTDVGSFIVSVGMPLGHVPIRQQKSLPLDQSEPTPIERRVISRILKSAQKARNIALSGDKLDSENDYKDNLNANLAESLAGLKQSGLDINVELSAAWNKTVLTPDLPSEAILIEDRTFEALQNISNVLRGSIASRTVHVFGYISSLMRDDIDDDDGDNTITIRTNTDELPKNMKVALSTEDYQKACDWHRDKKKISIKGILEKSGKSWVLIKYSELSIIS